MSPSNERPSRIGGLVLAAGQSSRFGGAKLLALIGSRSLVWHVLETASAARLGGLLVSTHAVVAEADVPIADLTRQSGAVPVINPDPARGLSSSLALGLAAIGDLDAALVLLGDQPLVRLEVIEALVRAWRESGVSVVRPRYARTPEIPGHPVLLTRSIWPLAMLLEGDSGFGKRFAPGATGVLVVDVPGENPDVNTPADLLKLKDPGR